MLWTESPISRQRVQRGVRLGMELLEDRSLPDGGGLAGLLLSPQVAAAADQFAASRILVRFKDQFGPFVSVPGTSLGRELNGGLFVMNLASDVSVAQAVAAYQADPRVQYAQPDYTLQIDNTPNDPSYPQQWALNNVGQSGGATDADINAPEAWDLYTGTKKVIVAVIDTGVNYNHPDLMPNMWVNTREIPGNNKDDDGDGYVDDYYGWDFYDGTNDPMDTNGHGTHVAGTIGAIGNNAFGVTGVAWNVTIMPLKFIGPNGGSTSDAIDAIKFACTHGATISNNSWGGGGFDQALYDTIKWARDAYDHIFVAAAGNNGANGAIYPAAYNLDNIISVAATDNRDNLASFSNYGADVDLAAPGVNILSTWNNGGYNTISGTSMATPHVTGAAALIRGLRPEMNYSEVINDILSTVDVEASLTGKVVSNGRLDLYKALANLPGGDTDGPHVTSASPSGPVTPSVSSVALTFNEDVANFDASDIVSFTGPGGVDLRSKITGVTGSGTNYVVSFAAQSAPGSYSMVIGPDVTDASGNQMNQDRDAINGEVPDDRYVASFSIVQNYNFNSSDVPKAIQDRKTVTSKIVINQDINIRDLNLKLYLTHTWDADLQITIKSPGGATVLLSAYRGGAGDNYGNSSTDTVFDDEATVGIAQGSAPFIGTFRPEDQPGNALGRFDNQSTKGTWLLSIYDRAVLDTGTLRRWSLNILGEPNGGGGNGGQGKGGGGKNGGKSISGGSPPSAGNGQVLLLTQSGVRVASVPAAQTSVAPQRQVEAPVSADKHAIDQVFTATKPVPKLKLSSLATLVTVDGDLTK